MSLVAGALPSQQVLVDALGGPLRGGPLSEIIHQIRGQGSLVAPLTSPRNLITASIFYGYSVVLPWGSEFSP
ncbi:hypothetical protein RRG08_057016 [Elysia crispata]|uniref:Uncharacterized protein n=1 Tax=Elysia crispata TaxID=231223 RepID=A0AAE0Z6F1_9GAST|nr:hypothetical protein RRG08_057016 [Elysia crispata]